MKFNEKLIQLRKQKNMTQEDLASLLGISRQAVSKWENGACEPDIAKLKEVAKLYDVSVDYLLFGDDNNEITDDAEKSKEINNINNYIYKQDPWFITAIISFIVFIVMLLIGCFADLSLSTTDHGGFIGFLETWTLEVVILKIIGVISIFLFITSTIKIIRK